ncbi:MAG: class II SORL domain-containing protein [Elusimicrobia bacterium]|nr:class II SORL domain-containing protein [Elusimicrobiota bacterium]
MKSMKDLFHSGDWKKEKHVPVIEVSGKVKKGEACEVIVTIGKEISHPNTTGHHIRWLQLYFLPKGGKFPFQIGKYKFSAHGESTRGLNVSAIYTLPQVKASFKTDKSGTIYALSYCNVHGLWENSHDIVVKGN